MIKKEKIDGEEVIVMYLDDKFQPCDEKVATNIKVRYPNGRVVFARPAEPPSEESLGT